MTEKTTQNVKTVLERLAEREDEPLSSLAAGLLPAAGLRGQDFDGPGYKEIRERISAIAEHLVGENRGPSVVIEALLAIDTAVAASCGSEIPWAMRLASLAVERYLHALSERRQEEQQTTAAELSPIFQLEPRTLVAVPISRLSDEGRSQFVDRVLSEALYTEPRKVVLVLKNLESEQDGRVLLEELKTELEAQKVIVEQV